MTCDPRFDTPRAPPAKVATTEPERGWVYVIGPAAGPYKIGFSRNVPQRLRDLQAASPAPLRVHFLQVCATLHPRLVESRAHEILDAHRQHGEWFACPLGAAIGSIRRATDDPRAPTKREANRCAWVDRHRTRNALAEYQHLHDEWRGS